MELIIGGRATGKTYRLVREAAENNGCIWVGSYVQKHFIEDIARIQGVKCPPVYSADDVRLGKVWSTPMNQRRAYIDNLDSFLYSISNGTFQIKQAVIEPETIFQCSSFHKIYTLGDWQEENNNGV